MKKNYLFSPVNLLAPIAILFFISCTKQKNETLAPVSNVVPTVDIQTRLFGNGGSVKGMILPLGSEVKIAVYNNNFISSNFYYNRDMSFQIDRIPTGIYSVFIVDLSTSREYIVPDIKVKAGNITDIGIIRLQ